ncbi:hypothetical protein [Methylobacterium sp. J-070]|uniref:hypothetical protein n=1 Tax=Methylobacterium sp. J-070 TaxID=2836650 RepID=UPI001FBAD3C6|nr:hypothetical protein [Methylobacterium sp. J-070]MCJ2053917.1 hypothetical protein [Methylobacterium sp. J-070]
MNPLAGTLSDIRRLALKDWPGSIVLAEHAVDQHAEIFSEPADRLTALDALARDLSCLGRAAPHLAPFLRRVDDYIHLIRNGF